MMNHRHSRFVVIPASEPNQNSGYIVYDTLLEQGIGQPHTSMMHGLEMAEHLNLMVPQFTYNK
jgi:hypothetical protein